MNKIICAAILSILIISCKSNYITRRDRVRIDGDELPGIGASKEKPDTVIMYYDNGHHIIVLKYKPVKQ